MMIRQRGFKRQYAIGGNSIFQPMTNFLGKQGAQKLATTVLNTGAKKIMEKFLLIG